MSNPAAKHRTSTPQIAAAVLCALAASVLFHWFGSAVHGYVDTNSMFWWWSSQWLDSNADSEHGWLVLGLSAWLLWRNVRAGAWEQGAGGKRQERTPNSELRTPNILFTLPLAAFAAMLAGLALHAIGFVAQQTRVSILAFLLFTWGVLRLGGGRRWGAAAAFPLAFMVFAIPINALDSIGFWLRVWVVDASGAIARAAGIAVLQSGTQLASPDGSYNYDVAAACSGIRSLTAMAALSLLAGYLNFNSWWRRALVLLLCFPLVYVGNVARIVAIVFAAEAGGPKWGDIAHEVMGYGIFVIVLGGVLGAIALMRRFAPEPGPEFGVRSLEFGVRPEARRCGDAETGRRGDEGLEGASGSNASGVGDAVNPGPPRRAVPTLVAGIVVVLAVGEMFFLHTIANSPVRGRAGVVLADDGLNPVELPAFVGTEWIGRRAEVTAVEREILPADTGFSRKTYVSLADPSKQVFLSIVLSGRDRTSIHRPEVCMVGQGWTITGKAQHEFRIPGYEDATFSATVLRVRREVPTLRGPLIVPEVVAYWFVSGEGVVATHWQRFARDAWNRVTRARADRWAYVLMQTDARDGEAAALARMRAVLDETLPAFQPWPRSPEKQPVGLGSRAR